MKVSYLVGDNGGDSGAGSSLLVHASVPQSSWLGIGINGAYRAYPRRIIEVREMVNDTLGGRDLGTPCCTLCGADQAYFTDQLPDSVERPILRTSGLLIRPNKVM